MKRGILFLLFLFLIERGIAQNVGIGTTTPITKLDILGGNWDLVNGEGDLRIGNNSYRLKIGMATGGAGAGATSIMQFGQPNGYNVLSLGAQGNYILQLNGNLNSAGIGTDYPAGKLEVSSLSGLPQLLLTQQGTGDYARIRFRNNNSLNNNRLWDCAGFISSATASTDRFVIYNPAVGNIVTITGDGLTGFGTNNPSGKLDVNSTSSSPQLQLVQGSTGDFARIRLKNGNSPSNTRYYDMAAYISTSGPADDRLNFFNFGGRGDLLGLAGNGAYYVNGSAGLPGQVLKSAGPFAPATWVDPVQLYKSGVGSLSYTQNEAASDKAFTAGGTVSVTCNQNSNLTISAHMYGYNFMSGCPVFGTCLTTANVKVYVDGVEKVISNWGLPFFIEGNWDHSTAMDISNALCQVGPGTHSVELRINRSGTFPLSVSMPYMTVMVSPQ